MIPPQLALFAAKHAKKLIYLMVFGAVLFTIWLAFNYHERIVKQNGELRGELASTELARTIDAAKMEAQAGAIEQWRESHAQLQATLQRQEQVSSEARDEKRNLNEIFRDHDLTRLAAAKPVLVERIINRGTARMQRLFVCASSTDRCDDDGHPDPTGEDESSATESARVGALQVARAGAGILPRPGRSVLLRSASGLRSSSQESSGDSSVHPGSHVAARLLSKGRY